MEARLVGRLRRIEEQIEILYRAQETYLTLDAAKARTLATLMMASQATSQAAKQTEALSTTAWGDFALALALAEADFHKQRHLYELKLKAYDAEHLSLKVEVPAINRQV